ncbi:hypothetical protein PHYBOEH_000522 [Phytophthora boehmeriae]|uniref:RxLR effector protein n=1 Tax=Phytophthora boehmeriae TaxID=109152 RepID=A0A8T1V9V0_9STRA|nr:hypothetical protein PHYBOEH_000522 [Phytophthora boehmeriae]
MRCFIVLLMITLAVSISAQSTTKYPEQAAISMTASPTAVRAVDAGNKRFLRDQDDADNEERAIGFKSLAKKFKNVFLSKIKLVKPPLPNKKELDMMSYRDDIAFPFFKSWVELDLPLANVVRIVNNPKIVESFMRYKITATGGL